MADGAAALLGRALAVLEAEAPFHHGRLRAALSDLRVELHVSDERLLLTSDDVRVRLGSPDGLAVDVRVATSLAAALALLDDEQSLLASVRRGAVELRGRVDRLAAAADVMSLFLHGLVRCASGASLLVQLRAAAAAAERGISG